MTTSIFFPKTLSYVKNKAKQLKKAFPGLPLSVAQEATAKALGFRGWFDCSSRLKERTPQTAVLLDLPTQRIARLRRHQQYCALVDTGYISSSDAEGFVRCWSLTSNQPATHLSEFQTVYTEFKEVLSLPEQEQKNIEQDFKFFTEGVAWGLLSKYNYYALDSKHFRALPACVRGNSSVYLDFEIGKVLSLFFHNIFTEKDRKAAKVYLARFQPWLHELILGEPPKNFTGMTIKAMQAEAKRYPKGWYPLSCRIDFERMGRDDDCYVPAITGAKYLAFLESKGEIESSSVRWFRMKYRHAENHFGRLRYLKGIYGTGEMVLPEALIESCEPFYHSPFKHGPLWDIEFSTSTEGGGLKLSDEIEWE
jgi:hypothetical protein